MNPTIVRRNGVLGTYTWGSGFKPCPQPTLADRVRRNPVLELEHCLHRAQTLRAQGQTEEAGVLETEARKIACLANGHNT